MGKRLTRHKVTPLTSKEEGMLDYLKQLDDEIESLNRILNAKRTRRDGLVFRLVNAGLSWRMVAEAAGIKNTYISVIKRKFEESNEQVS